MRALSFGIAAIVLFAGSVATAQDRRVTKVEKDQQSVLKQEAPSYERELLRHDDPKLNARRAAQFKAEQRRWRLASQQWYGVSNLRPIVNPTPFMGTYSPMWVGNGYNEHHWHAAGQTYSPVYVDQNVFYTR